MIQNKVYIIHFVYVVSLTFANKTKTKTSIFDVALKNQTTLHICLNILV